MDFDRLLTAAPINKQAACHLVKNGEHYNPTKDTSQPGYRDLGLASLPVRAPSQEEKLNPGFTDFTGFRWGRAVVVGVLDADRTGGVGTSGGGARWVCRCACGAYEVRKTKIVRRADPENGMCGACHYQVAVRDGKTSGTMPVLKAGIVSAPASRSRRVSRRSAS